MSRPRLLTLTPDYPPAIGGIQLLLARLVEHLPQFEHLVVTRGTPGAGPQPGVRRTRPGWGRRASIVQVNTLAARSAFSFRPDVILNGHVTTTPAAVALHTLLRRPMLTYIYADEVPAHPRLTRSAARHSHAVVAISDHARTVTRAQTGGKGNVVIVAPGLDQPEPPPAPSAGAPGPVIVTVARLVDRYKGHALVLEAMPEILRAVPGARWVVVGDGPLRPELEARSHELGLGSAVTFTGSVSDAERNRLLSSAAVFVMPSRLPSSGMGGEGFGIVYLEAGLYGVPSVAGAVGGALDAIIDGETGLLVDPRSPGEIAGALIRLLTDEPLRARLGTAARERAHSFTWARMAAGVAGLLEEAIDGAPAPQHQGRPIV